MTTRSFAKPLSAIEARFEAQRIAFAPVVFQCVRIAWRWGLLERLDRAAKGLTVEELVDGLPVSPYAARVVLETCLSAGVTSLVDDRYVLEKTGQMFVHDAMTQVNVNFNHDVCYRGMFELEAALLSGKPAGLGTLGLDGTIYDGLDSLAAPARSAWFEFDHFYSDSAFSHAMPQVFATAPRRLMDVGANTGKFARQCLAHDVDVHLTLVDLPGQLDMARRDLGPDAARVTLHPVDMLDPRQDFPGGQDVVWMSQFLSCFGLETVQSILDRARRSLCDGGQVLVLDTFWDRQAFDIAAYCVINTSPYFTALANGRSKMYESRDYVECASRAGLRLVDVRDGLGLSHSLMRFAPA